MLLYVFSAASALGGAAETGGAEGVEVALTAKSERLDDLVPSMGACAVDVVRPRLPPLPPLPPPPPPPTIKASETSGCSVSAPPPAPDSEATACNRGAGRMGRGVRMPRGDVELVPTSLNIGW